MVQLSWMGPYYILIIVPYLSDSSSAWLKYFCLGLTGIYIRQATNHFFEWLKMDTFNKVSKSRKIIDRVLGILLILISIAIAIFLVPSLMSLIKRTPYQLLEPDPVIRHMLGVDWTLHFIGLALDCVAFIGGRAFLRDSNKSSRTWKRILVPYRI